MQVCRIHEHGGPEVLRVEDAARPEPGPGEVLVRVLAVSINHLDLWVRRGMPGVKVPFPRVLGCDGTGEIAGLGPGVEGVEGLTVGQRVVIEPGMSSGLSPFDLAGEDHLSDDYGIRGEHCDGLYSEYVVIEARYALPLPAGLDPVTAAAAPLVFLTAWGLLDRAAVQAGETVLVLGGASGVGTAAIQIAKSRGARVLSTGGTAAKRQLALDLGAEAVCDQRDPEWGREVKRLTDGRGVDVVVEHIGPATWDTSMRVLARRGRLVTCGGTTGPKVSIVLPALFIKNLSVLGSTMGPRAALPEIFERLAAGDWRTVVDEVLPLSQAVRGHERLEASDVVGKIVLEPGQ